MRRTTDQTINVVCVGNSLTQNENGWLQYPQQLDALSAANVIVTNRGHGGWTTEPFGSSDPNNSLARVYPLEVIQSLSITSDSNILILWEGRNHLAYGPTPRQAADAYWRYTARAKISGYKVYIGTVIDTNPLGFSDLIRSQFNDIIRAEAAANNCILIDLAIVPGLDNRVSSLFVGDHIHLNTTGYGTVASVVGSAIAVPMKTPPPYTSSLFAYLEPQSRIDTSSEVSSWLSTTPATLTVTGAVGERPDIVGNVARFNGTTDRLTFAGNLLGATTKATICFWVKVSPSITTDDMLFTSSSDHFGTTGQLSIGTFNNERWTFVARGSSTAGGVNGTVDDIIRPDVWQFVACVYDGTQATMIDRTKVYYFEHGQLVPELQPAVQIASTPTSIPAGSAGIGSICDAEGLNRRLPCDIQAAYIYKDVALTTSEIVTLSSRQNPLALKKKVMALGDSLVVAVGDTAGHGGFREDLIDLQGGDAEAWWYCGTFKGTSSYVNNRMQAFGGYRTDQVLGLYNDAITAGWDPDIVLICTGRNDISQVGGLAQLPTRYTNLFSALIGKTVIVHTVVPPNNTPDTDTNTANAYLAAAAAIHPNVTIVTSSAYGAFDGVHPDPANYLLMAQAYWLVLRPLIVNST